MKPLDQLPDAEYQERCREQREGFARARVEYNCDGSKRDDRLTVEEMEDRATRCKNKGIGRKEFILSFEHKLRVRASTAWFNANGD